MTPEQREHWDFMVRLGRINQGYGGPLDLLTKLMIAVDADLSTLTRERGELIGQRNRLRDEQLSWQQRAETAERERDEAREQASQVTEKAINLISRLCSDHLAEAKEMSFGVFMERTEKNGCEWCAVARAEAAERERDETLKKLEKIKEISQAWETLPKDTWACTVALNRIHVIAGGKT